MANWYVSSVAYAAVTQWAAGATIAVGNYRRQLAAVTFGNERVFKCTAITTGITGGSEPVWSLNDGATTTDGGVTWTQVAGRESEQAANTLNAPFATIQGSENGVSTNAATIFVADNHSDSQAASYFVGSSSLHQYYSFDHTSFSVPPTSAQYKAGATFGTTLTNSIAPRGILFMKGFTISAGSAANAANINIGGQGGATVGQITLEDCSLVLNNTSSSSRFLFQPSSFSAAVIWLKNTKLTFGAVGQSITLGSTSTFLRFYWQDTAVPLAGSVPTNLFNSWNLVLGRIQALDLSSLNTTFLAAGQIPTGQSWVYDCQTHASLAYPDTPPAVEDDFLNFDNLDPSTNYSFRHFNPALFTQSDLVVVMSAGASDGVTSYAHKYTTKNILGATGNFFNPCAGDWMITRYETTGSAKTLTIEAIAFTSAIPTNVTMWLESEMLETTSSPLGSGHTTRASVPTDAGTALTATTTAWDAGSVSARANSHAYVLNDFIKLASNTGRVFICTTAGTSSGSEPGGYASAVDGGSVTDGTAIFRAGWRVKLTQAFTPRVKGAVRARVMAALATGSIFNVNPQMTIG